MSGITQDFLTLGNLIIVAGFIAGGLAFGKGSWQNFTVVFTASLPLSKLFGPAMIAVIFTYPWCL